MAEITKNHLETDPTPSKLTILEEDINTFSAPLLSKQIDLVPDKLIDIIWTLIQDGVPTISGHLAYAFTTLIYIYFVGHLNQPVLLASVSLGQQFSNVLCFAILCSLDSGFAALASQAFGARNYEKVGIYYQKTLVVYLLTSVPCVFVLLQSDVIFGFLGIENDVVENAVYFIKWMIPDYYILIFCECTKNYLMAQNKFKIQYVLSVVSAILATFYCLIFVTFAQMGIHGLALARICTDLSIAGILILYIKVYKPCEESWIPWTSEALVGLWDYFKEILMIGFPYYVEWQSWEANIILIGILNKTTVMAATGAAFPIIECIYSFVGGLAAAMSVYVGNAAGEGNKAKAKSFIKAGILLNFVQILVWVVLMNIFRYQIAGFITEDESVREVLASLITIYSVVYISDGNQINLTSILRTIGKERTVFLSALAFQTFIGISLGYVIGVKWINDYVGVWIGQGLGSYLMVSYMAYIMYTLDWDYEINRIHMRMKAEEEVERSIEMGMLTSI